MIFITVGTQVGFDRLIKQVDILAAKYTQLLFFSQIGNSRYIPTNFESVRYLTPDKFREHVIQSSLIITHAGIGTILVALKHNKNILVYPRKAIYNEHRNDHQLHTAKFLESLNFPQINVAYSDTELFLKFNQLVSQEKASLEITSKHDSLVSFLREYIVEFYDHHKC